MWHDEVLVTNGDSIWGRMTALVTSLVGHRCTPRERADAYEQLLLSSIRDDDKQVASVPIESMINDAAGKLAKIEDKNRTADKFRRKIGLLRRNGDENDEILRFLLLMADWDGILNSTPKSLFELPLRDTSNIPGYRRRYPQIDFSCGDETERHQKVMFVSSPTIYSICSDQTPSFCTSSIDASAQEEVFRNENDDETITEAMVFDERGNINGLAIDECLRSIWQLSNQSSFQMISWKDTMKCLQCLMRGQNSELIKRATTSSPFMLRNLHSTLSIEFEGPSRLISLVSPFIDFANKMQSIERSFCVGISESCSQCSLLSEQSTTHHTRSFHLLSFHLKQCFTDIRNDLCEELNVKTEDENGFLDAKFCMNRTLLKCATYSKFFDVIIAIQQHSDYGCSEMIDAFLVVRTLEGSSNETLKTLCDNILVILIQYFHRSVLRWICKGDECFDDGVFRINSDVVGKINLRNVNNSYASANIDDLVVLWRNDFGIQLRSNYLFDKEWCNKWMYEGKMRKLIHLSLDESGDNSVDDLNSTIDDASDYRLVISEEEYDLKKETIIDALHSLTSIQAIVSSKYQAIVNMAQAQKLCNDILKRFKETFSFIEDVFLGKNYIVIDTVISLLFHNDCDECSSPNKLLLTSENNNNNNLIRESDVIQQIYSALTQQKRYRRRFVKGLRIHVTEPNDDMFAMKLRYEPLFPLQIVFTTSSMDTFYEIWTLRSTLAIELAHLEKLEFDEILMSWHFMLMRSRMMSFLNTLQMFLQTQIDHVLATASLKGELLNSETLDEAHAALKQLLSALRRCCLLGAKHVMLMNVFDACIRSITDFRLAVKSIDCIAVKSAFTEFDENVQLFCNVLKVQSANGQVSLSNLLVLIGLSGFYIDAQQS